ncbi:MAG: TIGR02757 family protein [Paludibacteraceae bacterium]|nr:TIGR02757 family protein [Paludibacteraceae bacterium]
MLRQELEQLASLYETADFLQGDPSFFMHQVTGEPNQETMAFLAAAISYGSRKQFLPKIGQMLSWSEGEPYEWVLRGKYEKHICKDDNSCFYRLYTYKQMNLFLNRYQQLLQKYGSLKQFTIHNSQTSSCTSVAFLPPYANHHSQTTLDAIAKITAYFSESESGIIPKDTTSACKRLCMFLRWMVRDNSPVDLGIWADIIDKRTLIMPLDTHVLHQAERLGLIKSRNATMATAIKLTAEVAKIFPDDPLRADFALFGYGVNCKL